jgi:hypothetical protein
MLDTHYASFNLRDKPRASALGVVAGCSVIRQSYKPAFQPHVAKSVSPVEIGAACLGFLVAASVTLPALIGGGPRTCA